MRKFGSLIGAAAMSIIAGGIAPIHREHHYGQTRYWGGGAKRYRRSKYEPHQSYREAVRAVTKPGSDDRHLGFEVAKLAAANVGTARADFATFLDSLA